MKFFIAATCFVLALFVNVMAYGQQDAMNYNDNVHLWSSELQNKVETPENSRSKRAVDLRTLRQLMNNIAFSEYYRLRGLELLGTLGMGHGRPGGLPANPPGATQANSLTSLSVPSSALLQALASSQLASIAAPPSTMSNSFSSGGGTGSGKNGMFSFPLRSDEFQRFFGTISRSRSSNSRG